MDPEIRKQLDILKVWAAPPQLNLIKQLEEIATTIHHFHSKEFHGVSYLLCKVAQRKIDELVESFGKEDEKVESESTEKK